MIFWAGNQFFVFNIWYQRRKVLVPTFAPRNVTQFVTVFEAQSKVAADILASRVGEGNFSCYDLFNANSLDSICETVFGVNMDIQRRPDHPVFNIIRQCLKNIIGRVFKPWLHIDAIYKMLPVHGKQMRLMKIVFEFLDDLIYKTKAQMKERELNVDNSNNDSRIDSGESSNANLNHMKNTSDKSRPHFKTFVELIVENSREEGKGFTQEEIREETVVMVGAGTDTSAVATSFTVLLLAQHQDAQDKVYREIQEVLGNSDKPLEAADLLKLKYTRAVIKESLRLYPPVPAVTRHCDKDLELPSGLVLPKGCDVAISIWGIHRNPEHWGEDVDDFNPDRFISREIPANAFMPFSYGPRNCVGQQYAMLSMTTTLVTLLRRYRFTPATNFTYDKNKPFRLSHEIMLRHLDNFTCQVEYRDK